MLLLAGHAVPVALRMLAHHKGRTAAAACGVACAVLFLFVQLGLRGAVERTATAITARLDADLVLVGNGYIHLGRAGTVPRARVFQARGVAGVADAAPLYVRYATWRADAGASEARLIALGLADAGPAIRVDGLAAHRAALQLPDALLVDELSLDKCGPLEPDRQVRVRERLMRIEGLFRLGVGFLGDGALLVGDRTFAHLFDHSLHQVHLGLVRLAPGADREAVRARLRAAIPRDTRILSMDELHAVQLRHWLTDTAVGNIFGLGVLVGFCVGFAVLHQVLGTHVVRHLPEYATLKAIGFSERRLHLWVLQQALLYAALGWVPAFLGTLGIQALLRATTRLPVEMTWQRALAVLGLTLAMCAASGAFALRRLSLADPAEVCHA